MGRNKSKDAEGDQSIVFGAESPGAEPQREDIPQGTHVKEGSPPRPVNEPEPQIRKDKIRDADAYGLEQRRLFR